MVPLYEEERRCCANLYRGSAALTAQLPASKVQCGFFLNMKKHCISSYHPAVCVEGNM
jgi:hypothetical protein